MTISPERVATCIATDGEKWAKVLREANIKIE
jgi:hypothetical protein